MNIYYTDESGRVTGPVTERHLQQLLSASALSGATQICYEGSEEWQPISNFIQNSSEPAAIASAYQPVPAGQRNPLLFPLILIGALFLITIAGGAFYLGARNAPRSAEVPNIIAVVTPAPSPNVNAITVSPTPTPKPSVSEDTKSRVLNFIEKASKLAAMTNQGVAHAPFSDQLADVKSVWETLTLVSWPESWSQEKVNFESAIGGWSLAKDMWDRKIRLSSEPLGKMEYLSKTGELYDSRLKAYAAMVSEQTGDDSAARNLDAVYFGKSADWKGGLIDSDGAIGWCLSTASFSFGKARDGVKDHLIR